jgi:hypothetical protein
MEPGTLAGKESQGKRQPGDQRGGNEKPPLSRSGKGAIACPGCRHQAGEAPEVGEDVSPGREEPDDEARLVQTQESAAGRPSEEETEAAGKEGGKGGAGGASSRGRHARGGAGR